eukprot:scaffold240206_cov32-Tisochrysis_lutea.AAC.1
MFIVHHMDYGSTSRVKKSFLRVEGGGGTLRWPRHRWGGGRACGGCLAPPAVTGSGGCAERSDALCI